MGDLHCEVPLEDEEVELVVQGYPMEEE